MKYIKTILQFSCLLVLCLFLSSCGEKEDMVADKELDAAGVAAEVKETTEKANATAELPKRYQRPAYMIGDEIQIDPEGEEEDDVIFKVGATIRSTTGPQPLWDIMKRLAAMKNMNISWESDVDQNLLIDVDINANDDFYKSIDNLLRQVDYYHEMQDNTIVVKYKETRQYHIGMPFTKQTFSTGTGGNVLGSNDASSNIAGLISLDSKGNEFNLWQNIEDNLKAILNVWTTEAVTAVDDPVVELEEETTETTETNENETTVSRSSRRVSGNQNLYTIDKPIGLITVHAPRPLLNKLDVYFANLKKHLYRQISIEAKIIEVALTDASSIGINWSSVLKNFNLSGMVEFGSQALGGQVWPYIYSGNESGTITYPNGDYQDAYDPTRFVSKVTMDNKGFDVFLNALNEEGESKVLSNPKISVMNGQPALITVGRNVTYIDSIESDLDSDTGVITYTVNTERILSGVGMALTATIINDDEVVMNLVPVTSELDEPIEYREVGSDGGTVGLPIVNIREMSTTVRVKSGEMLVIGGLISDDKEEAGEFLPVLGSIPLVKYLFGYEEKVHTKRELIILLKPVVL